MATVPRFRGGGTGARDGWLALGRNIAVWLGFVAGTEFFVAYQSEGLFPGAAGDLVADAYRHHGRSGQCRQASPADLGRPMTAGLTATRSQSSTGGPGTRPGAGHGTEGR
jgi:hypothetical protein